ncbi:response regulator [Dyadobacter chenwenxiniae]|uniref:Response regulator n=1 Tax=Dyadobacter chenwenxiniae TaxID=2906456 RepID=A0A9X1PNA7_9BACT|nr:response regulator [Dyadobacter chenwenxiniae]MCF0064290.1 response regulator [Dyadobacter chenwenxiniae]UON82498.1 response regulator [Dyadobacter chenwenxiniae]
MELYIVDDNSDHQFLLYKLIKDLDKPYLVKFFESGRSLHKHMQQLSRSGQREGFPDLLVLDYNMPEMNGIELLRLLRQPPLANCSQINDIPIIIMTSDISPLQIRQCYQAGANAVVFKPLNFSVLRNTFQSICNFWIGQPE